MCADSHDRAFVSRVVVSSPPAGQTPTFDLHITTALADGTNGVVTSRAIMWSNQCTGSGSSNGNGSGSGSRGGDD